MGHNARWFYRDANDWQARREQLKHTPCPHCHVVGMLIAHGTLTGYDEKSSHRTIRARRVFCSNRQARRGCGRTVSVWRADVLRRLSVTTNTLWRFLQRAASDSLANAMRAVESVLSDRTWQRLWKRLDLAQSTIRTKLWPICPPPPWPTPQLPAAHVLAHLQAAFPEDDCPITAYQLTTRTFFY